MTKHIRIGLAGCLVILFGCAGASVEDGVSLERQGSITWRATCSRCHNARPARQFTPEQWPVIVNHMRTRADLTRSEAEAVSAYLQGLAATGPPGSP